VHPRLYVTLAAAVLLASTAAATSAKPVVRIKAHKPERSPKIRACYPFDPKENDPWRPRNRRYQR
jgi:hypothetical protein